MCLWEDLDMALSLYHTTYSSLATDIVSLVDDYKAKRVDEAALQEHIRAWSVNCPNLLFEKGNTESLSPTIIRKIGKKRGVLVLTAWKAINK